MCANNRGEASRVAHTNCGVKPTPVSITRSTVRVSAPSFTCASPILRAVSVPVGISGSLPSERLASAPSSTDALSGVPPSAVYSAVPSKAA